MTGVAHREATFAAIDGSGEEGASSEMRTYHPALEDYLAEVKRNIHGLVPRDRVEMYLGETAYWILCRAKMLETDGFDDESAVREATRSHDDPKQLAIALIEEYFESQTDGPLVKRMGRANAIVFTIFGLATGVYFLLLQLILAFPNTAALGGQVTPAELSRYYPALLPYPEPSWQFIVASCYPLVAPFLLGWLTGRLIPVRARESVLMGLFPIAAFSACASLLFLPDKTGVFFTLLVIVFWLPVACLTADFTSSRLRARSRTVARADGEPARARFPKANP